MQRARRIFGSVLFLFCASCGGSTRAANVGSDRNAIAVTNPATPNASAAGSSAAQTPNPGKSPPIMTTLSSADPLCGLDAEGRVWSWSTGSLEREAPALRGAKSVSCAYSHTCAVASDGTAWCWGSNDFGALGNGNETASNDPVHVVDASHLVEISVDMWRTCARTESGDVMCWGDSEFGKSGDGRLPDNTGREKTLPGKPILSGARTLTVAMAHACSAMNDGRLSCWGQNNDGACGQPLRTRYVPRPAFVPKLKDIVSVESGESATCTLDAQGIVHCWGNPFFTTELFTAPQPSKVVALPAKAKEIAVGDGHGCALLESAAPNFYCWGNNDHGQLGDGTTTSRAVAAPVKISGNVLHASAGLENTCAILEGGRVFCWGERMADSDHAGGEDQLVPREMTLP
ncbi:MAG: hypothetical protein ABI461_18680 [Polyangiaceae bacterium]